MNFTVHNRCAHAQERHVSGHTLSINYVYILIMMKLIGILLLAGMLHVSAAVRAQKITLDVKEAPLARVLDEIAKQSGYNFLFNAKLLQSAPAVTVSVRAENLEPVLQAVFERQPLTYTIGENTIKIMPKPKAPATLPMVPAYPEVKGRVVDSLGQPLVGASIRVLNAEGRRTTLQTKTDDAGYFVLENVPENYQIEISYIGYVSQTVVVAVDVGAITLKAEPSELEEVEVIVNTGYQSIPKERATGSFVFVDSVLFNRAVSTDIISRLKGVAPSLLFDERGGGDPLLSIRGRSTIYANAAPLIVVDNFPFEGDLASINPNDVESVSILRDAAAASIWGVRAGNGVIVITTKQGRLNQPLRINLNSNVTVGTKPNLWYEPRISSADMVDVEQFLYEQGYYDADIGDTQRFPELPPSVEILIDPLISVANKQTALDVLRTQDTRSDLDKYFYQQSIKQQYQIALQGGGNKHTYYYSAGWDNNRLSTVGNGFNRVNLHTQNTFMPWSGLQVVTGLFYTKSKNAANSVYRDVHNTYPYLRLIDESGNALAIPTGYRSDFVNTAEENGLFNWAFIPLDELTLTDRATAIQSTRAVASIGYTWLEGLRSTVRYQYERRDAQTDVIRSADSYYVRDLINSFSVLSPNGVIHNFPLGAYRYLSGNDLAAHNGCVQLSYEREWVNHAVHATAGFEARQIRTEGLTRQYYGYDVQTGLGSIVNPDSLYRQYPEGNRQRISMDNSTAATIDRFRSWFFNGAYTLHNRYTVSASARIDQSNLFGVNANQRSVPLWSTGVKWNILREPFMQPFRFSQLQLRATYGYSGNFDQNLTAFTTAQYLIFNGLPTANILNPPNPDLRWEKNAVFNIGLDFALPGDWLSGTVDYYRRRGTDLVGDGPLEPTTGLSSFRGNLAHMTGKGWDVELHSRNIIRPRFQWNTHFLFSYTADKVTKYLRDATNTTAYFGEALLDGIIPPKEGQPLSGVYSYRWAGLDPATGSPRGYLDGQPSTDITAVVNAVEFDDLIYHGYALPPVFGALRNHFTVGHFELSASIGYKLGYFYRRTSIQYDQLYRGNGSHHDYALRWQKPGDERQTQVPAAGYPANSTQDNFYANSALLIDKGDHIRIQDIRVSYTLGRGAFGIAAMQRCQIYAYLNNVGILWRANKYDIDPDYSLKRRTVNGGTMVMPAPFTMAFGIQLTL